MSMPSGPITWLVPISGPPIKPLELEPKSGGANVGRHEQCELRLPVDAQEVSRFHARLTFDSDRWWLSDLSSRWGTMLNGCAVPPGQALPLNEGDLVRITPWTFSFTKVRPGGQRLQSVDDGAHGQTRLRTFDELPQRELAEKRLTLLLESTAVIHSARTERELAENVLDVACRGTSLQNAAILRPLDNAGGIEIIAARMPASAAGGPTYSRSLIDAAAGGLVAELGTAGPASHSIMQLNIRAAICVPLVLETNGGKDRRNATVAAYLYLDSRGNEAAVLAPEDIGFCGALGRLAGLALANLKRLDIERRQAALMAEISAAAEAQRWILPQREVRTGPFTLLGQCRPGEHVGGDFYDIIPLSGNRVAVALGDVIGHGVGASVVMATAQGFLHSALQHHEDPARAVTELNRFLERRTGSGKFVTLWIGLLDPQRCQMTYVDAGHGYAFLTDRRRQFHRLNDGGGPPVGLLDNADFPASQRKFEPGDAILIVSDGIIEQYGSLEADGRESQFGLDGIEHWLTSTPPQGGDEVAALFEAVTKHAGGAPFGDDATALLVQWQPQREL